jgi:predicted small secreted protein
MLKRKLVVSIVGLICVALVTAGCETMAGSAGLGAALGSGTGAIIGHQSGHTVEGALIGAAVGALAGIIVHDIKARQTRNAQQTVAAYQYTPDQGVKIVGESGAASPTAIRPGGTVTTSVQYAVLGAGASGITVKETRTLRQNGRIIKQVSSQDFVRTDGTWESTQEINFPSNAPAGTYEVAQTVSAANGPQFQQNVVFNVQ